MNKKKKAKHHMKHQDSRHIAGKTKNRSEEKVMETYIPPSETSLPEQEKDVIPGGGPAGMLNEGGKDRQNDQPDELEQIKPDFEDK